jgi:long-chain fatty acid transport protein
MKWNKKQLCGAGFGLLLSLASSSVLATGFQLYEESAAGTGNYHAGDAAQADDAGTEFYNPAGMVRIKHPEISIGAVVIPLAAKFQGDVSASNGLINQSIDWMNGDTTSAVPNLHIVVPVNDRWAVGFGATVPFGLSTSYPWMYNLANGGGQSANLAGTVTKLVAFNFNPNVAFAVTPKFSVGAGVDMVYGSAEYDNAIFGSAFTNKMSGTAWGWNAGLLYQFTPHARLGLSYRSEFHLKATGTSKLYSTGVSDSRGDLSANLTLPDYAMLSYFQNVNPKWDVMSGVEYTRWNSFDSLTLTNTALPAFLNGPTFTVHENYRNTWNFALGANYHINPVLTFKMGAGYDITPTQDGYRDIRLPDGSRLALSAGMHAILSRTTVMDLGWIHFFGKRINIDNSQSGSEVVTIGQGSMNADVLGLQFSVHIV